jgi:hypothetical protein
MSELPSDDLLSRPALAARYRALSNRDSSMRGETMQSRKKQRDYGRNESFLESKFVSV